MKTIKQFFQTLSISWRQLLVIFLAGVMILFTTACSKTQASTTYGDKTTPTTKTKAERLVREAKQNVQKDNKNPQDAIKEALPDKPLDQQAKDLGRSAKRAAENAGESAKQAAKNAPEKTQKGLRNIKENLEDAADQARDTAKYSTNP